MFFDPLYLLVMVPGMLLSLWASLRVKSTFKRYSQVGSRSGLSGADAARELLRRQNIQGVRVEPVDGFLSDHYDPSSRTLRLSPDVYHAARSPRSASPRTRPATRSSTRTTTVRCASARSWCARRCWARTSA